MSPNQSRADAPRYPVLSTPDATLRAEQIIADIGLDTDLGIEDRLETGFGAWMDQQAASHLAHEVKRLYWLLIDPRRSQPDKPIDAPALLRSMILAMSRPTEDECWRDYQRIQEAIYQRWLAEGAMMRGRPRLLRRHRPSHDEMLAREKEWQRPISEARAQFIATWRR